MRGVKAKMIRKQVYNDHSLRYRPKLVWDRKIVALINPKNSLRWFYRHVKALYRKGVPFESN